MKKPVKKYPPIGLSDTIPFGIHKGKELWEVIDDYPDYIKFLVHENMLSFTDGAFLVIQDSIDLY